MRIAELEVHPADTADRRKIAQDDFDLGYCSMTKCCTEVQPRNFKITDNELHDISSTTCPPRRRSLRQPAAP